MNTIYDIYEGIMDRNNRQTVGTDIERQNCPTSKDIQSAYNVFYVEFAPRFLMDIVKKYDFTTNPRNPQKNFRAIQFILSNNGAYWKLSLRLMNKDTDGVKYITTTDTESTAMKYGKVQMIRYVQRLYENPDILDAILMQEKLYIDTLNRTGIADKKKYYINLSNYMI